MNKLYITSENISKFAKVQGASSMGSRGDVVLMWDELDREGKKLAKHIEIEDIEVRTSDPYNVPDKWNDNVTELDSDPEAFDLIKQVIANPSRADVFDLLLEEDPPEPLMLWWANVCFSDPDYFKHLADVCWHGLFRTDTRYLWGAMAFGVEHGEGKFHWPSSGDEDAEIKSEILEEYDVSERELEKAWSYVGDHAGRWVSSGSSDDEDGGDGSASSLLEP